jgi:hypothetical protein
MVEASYTKIRAGSTHSYMSRAYMHRGEHSAATHILLYYEEQGYIMKSRVWDVAGFICRVEQSFAAHSERMVDPREQVRLQRTVYGVGRVYF